MKAYFFGETKQMVNGKLIEDKAIKSEYDGKNLHIDKVDNTKVSHAILKHKELEKILASPTSDMDLLKRLNRDFMRKRTRKRKGKGKGTKKQKYRKGKA